VQPLSIVYQDDVLVAMNKPSGLLVHRSPIDRCETEFAVQRLRDQIGCHVYPVHRLDKPTSGLLLFALNSDVARTLAEQFESRRLHKEYWAVVRGHVTAAQRIDHPLNDEVDHRGQRFSAGDGASREAFTDVTPLRTWTLPMPVDRYPEARYSLVSLVPHTGRYRQLRRHMKHISHPIVGDSSYGKGSHNRFFRDHFASHRLLLAAVSMTFLHPVTNVEMTLSAPLLDDYASVLEQLAHCADDSVQFSAE